MIVIRCRTFFFSNKCNESVPKVRRNICGSVELRIESTDLIRMLILTRKLQEKQKIIKKNFENYKNIEMSENKKKSFQRNESLKISTKKLVNCFFSSFFLFILKI